MPWVLKLHFNNFLVVSGLDLKVSGSSPGLYHHDHHIVFLNKQLKSTLFLSTHVYKWVPANRKTCESNPNAGGGEEGGGGGCSKVFNYLLTKALTNFGLLNLNASYYKLQSISNTSWSLVALLTTWHSSWHVWFPHGNWRPQDRAHENGLAEWHGRELTYDKQIIFSVFDDIYGKILHFDFANT